MFDLLQQIFDLIVGLPHSSEPQAVPLVQLSHVKQIIIHIFYLELVYLLFCHVHGAVCDLVHGQGGDDIVSQVDVAAPLKFLEVVDDGRIHLLYAVHHDEDADLIRTHLFVGDQVGNVIGHSAQSALQHLFVFAVHAHADRQFDPRFFFHHR